MKKNRRKINVSGKIRKRIYHLGLVSTNQMMGVMKVADYFLVNDEITKTVFITYDKKPVVYLNSKFIKRYCKTDAHLFMLIMHQVYHIILGHLTMLRTDDEIAHLSFDAIINARLCRLFPTDSYTSFFTELYKAGSFPSCILRPKGKKMPKKYYPVLKSLYESDMGTYQEVYDLFQKEFSKLKMGKRTCLLLGEFNLDDANETELLKAYLQQTGRWKKEASFNDFSGLPFSLLLLRTQDKKKKPGIGSRHITVSLEKGKALKGNKGRGTSDNDEGLGIYVIKDKNMEFNDKFRKLLFDSAFPYRVNSKCYSTRYEKTSGLSYLPDYHDRSAYAKSLLYEGPFLYNTALSALRLRENKAKSMNIVYMDVSGSMSDYVSEIIPFLLKPLKEKKIEVYAFSTKVFPVSYETLKTGLLPANGGTDISCVYNHYFNTYLAKKMKVRKILVLTDGYIGTTDEYDFNRIKTSGLKIYFGIFGDARVDDLADVSDEIVRF